jgi:hypothetical protein
MRLMPIVSILVLWAAFEGWSAKAPAQPGDSTAVSLGSAFALDGGTPAYTEEHEERYAGGRLQSMKTLYKDGNGKVLAERSLDFSFSSTRPSYHLRDLRNGYEEGAIVENGEVKVFSRPSKGAAIKEKTLKVPEPFVIDGGFHPFLKERWADLAKGGRVSFYFVVPSRLDFFRFVAYSDPGRAAKGKDERVWIAVPQSRVLRMMVEPIVATYDSGSRRMKEYRGLSNIEGPDGKSQKVRLVYREPGL